MCRNHDCEAPSWSRRCCSGCMSTDSNNAPLQAEDAELRFKKTEQLQAGLVDISIVEVRNRALCHRGEQIELKVSRAFLKHVTEHGRLRSCAFRQAAEKKISVLELELAKYQERADEVRLERIKEIMTPRVNWKALDPFGEGAPAPGTSSKDIIKRMVKRLKRMDDGMPSRQVCRGSSAWSFRSALS